MPSQMTHVTVANRDPTDISLLSELYNPEELAVWHKYCQADHARGVYALAQVRSRAHWTMVNGHWFPRAGG